MKFQFEWDISSFEDSSNIPLNKFQDPDLLWKMSALKKVAGLFKVPQLFLMLTFLMLFS